MPLLPCYSLFPFPVFQVEGSRALHPVLDPNKRSMDLGTLLDNSSWYDKWQFSADFYQILTD